MPNLYATIGYSANALTSYMQYVSAQAKNTFHAKDREAIYLIVSELNGCPYCLASHTQSAKSSKPGGPEEGTLRIRAGTYPERKWEVIYGVIVSAVENKGGVSKMSFTNYVYRLTEIPIDFPPAQTL